MTLTPKKSFKTEISTLETKQDIAEKISSPKGDDKMKNGKPSEVIKQIEAQIQLHRRIKKPDSGHEECSYNNILEGLQLRAGI